MGFGSGTSLRGAGTIIAAMIVTIVFVLFVELSEVQLCSSKVGGITSGVNVYADTILEVNGVAGVPPVFGLTAYSTSGDFAKEGGQDFLMQHHIDIVGLGTILGDVLPQGSNISLNTLQLKKWLESDEAQAMYEASTEYELLSGRWLEKAGAKPFIFLKNPDGSCTPHCEALQCLPQDGTPKTLNGSTLEQKFKWWSELFAGFFSFVMKADPNVDLVHIWNEPNAHFYQDGKNGTYYAEFYSAIATALKAQWPHVKFGGPVTWDPPNGPLGGPSRLNYFGTWEDYVLPLIDTAFGAGLLDFVDFHAYDTDATALALQSAVETIFVYTSLHHNKPLPSAITETNFRLYAYPTARCVHFYNRTFPLILSTLALLQHPEKIYSRLVFDYKANNPDCNCGFVTNETKPTPDAEMYSILGKLSTGTLLYMNYTLANSNHQSQCQCYNDASMGDGTVVAVAAAVDKNITVALVNTCNCSKAVALSFYSASTIEPTSSWAAIVDTTSLRDVAAPTWPQDDIILPPLSLMVASYEIPSTPRNILRRVTVLPTNPLWVMRQIPVDIPCHYVVPLSFNISNVVMEQTERVALRLSILGKPGLQEWQISYTCQQESQFHSEEVEVDINSPGLYTQTILPCLPQRDGEGLTSLSLTTLVAAAADLQARKKYPRTAFRGPINKKNRMHQDVYQIAVEEIAYFAFASLLFDISE